MLDRKLNDQEKLAIDNILEDAERRYLHKSDANLDLDSLDQQCRDIWSDWDFSVPAYSRSPHHTDNPNKSIHKSPIVTSKSPHIIISEDSSVTTSSSNLNYKSSLSKNGRYNDDDDDDDSEYNVSRHTSGNLSESESETTVNIKHSNSKIKSSVMTPKYHITDSKYERNENRSNHNINNTTTNNSTRLAQKNRSVFKKSTLRKKSPKNNCNTNAGSCTNITSATSKNQFQPFNRSDAARLRQDNIALKAQVTRLQAALDRANYENTRLKDELSKSEKKVTKQNSVISYLKEEKLYGNK